MSQTNKIILIVVETTRKANTDVLYISKAIDQLYKVGNEIKIDYEYLTTKAKYNDSGNIKRINRAVKNFSESHIVYCLDTDDITVNPSQVNINKKIENFCNGKGYDLIWFCRDIEEVFLHKQVDNTKKIDEAKKFGRQRGLGQAIEQTLSCEHKIIQKSNFLIVLDNYLKRK